MVEKKKKSGLDETWVVLSWLILCRNSLKELTGTCFQRFKALTLAYVLMLQHYPDKLVLQIAEFGDEESKQPAQEVTILLFLLAATERRWAEKKRDKK